LRAESESIELGLKCTAKSGFITNGMAMIQEHGVKVEISLACCIAPLFIGHTIGLNHSAYLRKGSGIMLLTL